MRHRMIFVVATLVATFSVPQFSASTSESSGETMRRAIAKVLPAVVVIESRAVSRKQETGSGFMVSIGGRWYVLTSGHLASRMHETELLVTLHNRRIVRVTQTLVDDDYDLAVLFIDIDNTRLTDTVITAATVGDSDSIGVGDTVLAVGHPFGLRESVSRGIITGTNRRRIPAGNTAMPLSGFLQTDASINPGNSGGPLLNERGEVIGLVTAIASISGTHEGVAFAMPINVAMRVARQLVMRGSVVRPLIGLELDPLFDTTARLDAGLDRAIGTRIRNVVPDSLAAKAGLLPGDIVISLDGYEIEDDRHLIQLIAMCDTDTTFSLRLIRHSATLDVTVTLAAGVKREE